MPRQPRAQAAEHLSLGEILIRRLGKTANRRAWLRLVICKGRPLEQANAAQQFSLCNISAVTGLREKHPTLRPVISEANISDIFAFSTESWPSYSCPRLWVCVSQGEGTDCQAKECAVGCQAARSQPAHTSQFQPVPHNCRSAQICTGAMNGSRSPEKP